MIRVRISDTGVKRLGPGLAAAATLICIGLSKPALADTCPVYTYTFSNGTTADATQVNANFATIANCANTLLAPQDSPNFTGIPQFHTTLTSTTAGDTVAAVFVNPSISPGASSGANFIGLGVFQNLDTASALTGVDANAPTGSTTLNYLYGASTIAELAGSTSIGLWAGGDSSSLGTVTSVQAGKFIPVVSFDNSLTTTITKATGVHVVNSQKGAFTITGQVGIAVDAISGATNNTALLLGQTAVPSGQYGIYNASISDNYINGNLGVGTASPTQKLDVNGQVHVATFASATATHVCQNDGVLANCSSSIRYKEDVQTAPFGLREVLALHPVTFKWKGRDEADFGLIAEEVAKVNPLFATYVKGRIEGVKYEQLTAILIGAVKELAAENATLVRQGAAIELQVKRLKNENEVILTRLEELEHRSRMAKSSLLARQVASAIPRH